MATHDYVIDNSTGANVRADINLVLQAILTNNSSSSAPSTTAAYMWWADTTNGVLKIRNSSNNDWVELLQLDGSLTLEDGSASTPALAFRDDLNTGIFSSAADTFNVATAGVERMELGATTIFNEDGADVDFRIEGDTNANLFYVDAGNNRVGIGTASPNTLLELSGGGNTTLTVNTGNNSGDNSQIAFGDSADADVGFINYDHGTHVMQFAVAASERMRIDSSGRMLIGTTTEGVSGADELTVATSGDTGISIRSGSSNSGKIFFSDATTGAGEYTGGFEYAHSDNSMRFFTNDGAERMRLGSDGSVYIGTTSGGNTGSYFQNDNNSRKTLNIGSSSSSAQNQIIFRNSNDRVGSIQTSGTSTSYNTTFSDIASKKNFENWTEDVLSLFKNINPQKFNFKVEDDSASKSKGFIAQEMVDKFPEAYVKQEEEMYMFNPSGMVVYLMKALQEAVVKIEVLETKVAALEAK